MLRGNNLRQRVLVLGAAVLLAAGIGLYYWKTRGLIIAAILGTLLVAYQVLQSSLPQAETIEKAAASLADLVDRNWGAWRRVLLSESVPADVAFARMDELRLGEASGGLASGELTSIYPYYARLAPERLVILGSPGSGKTLLAIELALQLLEAGREGRSREQAPPVAVPVAVAGWTGETSLDQFLVDRLAEAYHLSPVVARKLVDSHRILPVLDGLDEIAQDRERGMDIVKRVLSSVNSSVRGTRLSPVVITCREDFYQDLNNVAIGVRDATVVRIEALTPERIVSYLEHRFLADAASRRNNPEWKRLSYEIRQGGEPVLLKTFAVPWLIALATTAYESGRATLRDLEAYGDQEQLKEFLVSEFIPATVTLHPKTLTSKLLGDPRLGETYRRRADPSVQHDPARVTGWLTVLARHLGWQAAHRMSPTDLLPHQLWRIAEASRRRVRAVHTTIAVLMGLLVGSLAAEFTGGTQGVIITGLTMALGVGFGLRAGLWKDPIPSRVNIRLALASPWILGLIIAVGAAAGTAGTIDGGATVGITEAAAAMLASAIQQ